MIQSLQNESVYVLLVDPPLPRLIAWIPVACRGLAMFLAFPFLCFILLDIVAYLIARTLHIRPKTMRVPRSPATSILKPSPLRENDLPLPPGHGHGHSSEDEESPLLGVQGLPQEKMVRGLGVVLGDERVVADDGGRVCEKDVNEEEVGRVDLDEQEREQEQELKVDNEPLETPAIPLPPHNPPPIPLGPPIPSKPQTNPGRSPSPIDELETEARFGQSDSPLPGQQARASEMEDWADEALSGFTGGKKSARSPAKGDEFGVRGETILGDEGVGSDAHDEKNGNPDTARAEEPRPRGFEPKGAHQTRSSGWTSPGSDSDEWVPPDFKGKGFQGFSGSERVEEPEVDLEALGRGLAQEKDEVFVKQEEGEERGVELTMDQLKDALAEALSLKNQGNVRFQASEPDLDGAIGAYKSALDTLPVTSLSPKPDPPRPVETPKDVPDVPESSGITELTDEQAEALARAEQERREETRKREEEERDPVVRAKRDVEREIEGLKKVLWGNLGAVWVTKGDDKEAVTACTEALKLDSTYVKVLQRRATANDRIGSWSSLTSAQEDYKLLLTLLPSNSPYVSQARRSLSTLPRRIAAQQEKEKDEMMSKLKELGDGILGRFGLSTNNFKFDQQEGGGYSMRFER